MDVQPVHTETLSATLSSSTGFGGSFTINYATDRDASDYASAARSVLRCSSKNELYEDRGQYSLAWGATSVTVTILTSQSYSSGETVYLDIDVGAKREGGGMIPALALAQASKMDVMQTVKINLGAPDTADANGYVESQDLTSAGVFSVNTTAAAALAAAALAGTADVPRNVVAAWTGTAVATVTGTDEFGNTIVESSASGTSLAGKKAFKTVTDFSVSANVTSLTVGTGDVLGLPCFVADAADVISEVEDGAAATAGTLVAGVATTATATTGDVRGTYDPNSAADGSAVFEITVLVRDPSFKGVSQYAG